MLDDKGDLIYLGKAKDLRSRLLSYFRSGSRPPKARKIIAQTRTLLWEVQANEFAALLRELELIRRWRPRWNVQLQPLRRRLTFACLGRAPAPYVFLSRRPPADCLASFGPLPFGRKTSDAICKLNDLFTLRDCPQPQEMIFPEQGELFPAPRAPGCLRFEIGTCLGPCTGLCPKSRYRGHVAKARRFVSGEDRTALAELKRRMDEAAQQQHFERAAALRNQWQALSWLTDRLDRIQEARRTLSFVYPLRGWDRQENWYCLHGGRVVAGCPAPTDAASRRAAADKIKATYRGQNPDDLLHSYEHADGLWLVAAWFRKYPKERRKILTPDDALDKCRPT